MEQGSETTIHPPLQQVICGYCQKHGQPNVITEQFSIQEDQDDCTSSNGTFGAAIVPEPRAAVLKVSSVTAT